MGLGQIPLNIELKQDDYTVCCIHSVVLMQSHLQETEIISSSWQLTGSVSLYRNLVFDCAFYQQLIQLYNLGASRTSAQWMVNKNCAKNRGLLKEELYNGCSLCELPKATDDICLQKLWGSMCCLFVCLHCVECLHVLFVILYDLFSSYMLVVK